jgi:preprotein translocase subunit SecF
MFNFNKNGLHVVKHRVLFMCLSALLLIPGIVAMIYSMITYPTHSPLKVGIDYTGGTILQYSVADSVSNAKVGEIREELTAEGITNTYIQVLKDSAPITVKKDDKKPEEVQKADDKKVETANKDEEKAVKTSSSIISVRTKFIDEGSEEAQKITGIITKDFPDAELVQVSSVGPTLSSELFRLSFIALIVAILGMIAYISFRFEFKYAVSAIAGLIHDVLFVMGVFSILGLFYNVEVDGLFLTAILTVIGYSVNDTIVTYDRIRENLRYYGKKMTFGEIVDASVQQTITRSINTSLTTLLALAALYFFGGVTTKDFVLAMMLGVLIGTYSSIFFCAMLIDFWTEKANAPKKPAVEG